MQVRDVISNIYKKYTIRYGEEMKKEKLTILISGGAGFIGSHLCEKYLTEGHRIICVDNLQTTISPKNILKFLTNKNFRFIKHDIVIPFDPGEKIDWIFNLACSGSYTIYQYDPVQTVKTNTVGMINMLELAKKYGARILQTSTSEIYGDPLETPQRENYKGNVNSLGPRACYDEGKRVAETLCMDYHREYSVDVKIVRIFNTYGPNMDGNDGRAITNFITNALARKDLIIYGDGSHTRSFQYVDDLVAGIDAMMKKDGFIGPVNLGNPGEVTTLELAQKVLAATRSKSKIVYQKKATDDPRRRCPDISLAKKELGWSPRVPLEEGLKKTIVYFHSVETPESRVLVFATSYYPNLGPAEQSLFELTKIMPDTKFSIITTRLEKELPAFEQVENNYIYRIGFGSAYDKFLLPYLGPKKALSLSRKAPFRFVWSLMASYAGLAGARFKDSVDDINFLVTFHNTEKVDGTWRKKIYKKVFTAADSVFLSDASLEKNVRLIHDTTPIAVESKSFTSFMNQVRDSYAELINKKERKLSRPK